MQTPNQDLSLCPRLAGFAILRSNDTIPPIHFTTLAPQDLQSCVLMIQSRQSLLPFFRVF